MLVREVMTHRPVTVRAESTVKAAIELLAAHSISALPVVDAAGHVHGVVSEADLIRELVPPDPRAHELPLPGRVDLAPRYVSEVMTTHPITVRPDLDLSEAVDLITSSAIKSVPVVDYRDRVVGVLSRADVIRNLARADEDVAAAADRLLTDLGLDEWVVVVEDGIAWLDGPDHSADRRIAQVAVARVPGVIDVRDDDGSRP